MQDMVLGKLSSLEGVKILQGKESLLDSALEWGDGEVLAEAATNSSHTWWSDMR